MKGIDANNDGKISREEVRSDTIMHGGHETISRACMVDTNPLY